MKKFTNIKKSMDILLSVIMCSGILSACSSDNSANSFDAFKNDSTNTNNNTVL